MLKFSILVLACLHSQASGFYFGRYDVIVRAVDDFGGGEATRKDASNLTRVTPTGLTGNEKNLIPNLTELAANNVRGAVVNEPFSHASEVIKNAIERLEDDTEKAEEAIAAAVASTAAVEAAADAAAPSEGAIAPTVKDATEDVEPADDGIARAATDNAEAAPVPPKSGRDAKRLRRRSRVNRKTGGIDYDYGFYPPPSTKRPYTGIVGVPEDYPVPRHSSRPRRTERPPPFDFPDKM